MKIPKGTGLVLTSHCLIYRDGNGDTTISLCGSRAEIEEARLGHVYELWKHKIDIDSIAGEEPTEEEFADMADDWGAWTDWEEELTNEWAEISVPASEILHVVYTAPYLPHPEIHTMQDLKLANKIALGIIRRERDRIGFPKDMNLVHCWQQLETLTKGRESVKIIPSATVDSVLPEENLTEGY